MAYLPGYCQCLCGDELYAQQIYPVPAHYCYALLDKMYQSLDSDFVKSKSRRPDRVFYLDLKAFPNRSAHSEIILKTLTDNGALKSGEIAEKTGLVLLFTVICNSFNFFRDIFR
jgi:hypothetical protein